MDGALSSAPEDLEYAQNAAVASAPGALTPGAFAPSPTAQRMQQQGEQLIGEDPAGALTAASAKKDAARQAQIEKINQAMSILRAGQSGVNLPLIAAGSALMAPTRTGGLGEAISNAGQAYLPAYQQQRKNDMDVQNLGIQAAGVASEGAREGYQDFLTRFGLGRQLESGAEAENLRRIMAQSAVQRAQIGADARTYAADQGAAARIAAANAAADSRRDVAGTNADAKNHATDTNADVRLTTAFKPVPVTKGPTIQTFNPLDGTYVDTGIPTTDAQRLEWQQNHGDRQLDILQQNADTAKKRAEQANTIYLGTSPDDPKVGIYLDRKTGDTSQGPAVAGKAGAADPAHIREANALVKQGVAPDFTTAYGMVRSGVNDTNTFQRLVQAEKKILQGTPQGMSLSDKAAEAQARETVIARAKAAPGTGAQPGSRAPVPAPAPTAPLRPIDQGTRQQYDDAIAAGKPKAALIQRLKQSGYDTSGL